MSGLRQDYAETRRELREFALQVERMLEGVSFSRRHVHMLKASDRDVLLHEARRILVRIGRDHWERDTL